MNKSDEIAQLAAALLKVQAEIPTVVKDKTAKTERFSYDYVGLDTVMPLALGLLNKYRLALVQTVGNGAHDGGSTLTTMLIHESGEWLSDTAPLIIGRMDSQGQGSAITYARRYGLMAMIGMVAEEDDDGAAASAPSPAQQYSESGRQATAPESRPTASGGPKKAPTKFDGVCYVCGNKYFEGEEVYYQQVEGKWLRWHVACEPEQGG